MCFLHKVSLNTNFQNINRESDRLKLDIQDLERARERLLVAIDTGTYYVSPEVSIL